MTRSARLLRMPAIIEAWFIASDNTTMPGMLPASVDNAASLATKPEVNTSADSVPCRSASSRSSNTCAWLVPEMLRVPPAPAPVRRISASIAASTAGCWPMPR